MIISKQGIRLLLLLILLPGCILISSCDHIKLKSQKKLFTLMPASVTHADFINKLDYDKQLESKFNIYTFRNFYNGGGVGLGDINNDGLTDIVMGANMGTNVLYLNKGDFRFEDISRESGIQGKGWSTGISIADINGDGFQDIYVCKSGNIKGTQSNNELYINNGDLSFTEKAVEYGIAEPGNSTQGVFFDYDKDGDLDLFLLKNYPKAISSFNLRNNQRSNRDSIGGDKLFRNDNNRFTDVSSTAGIYGSVIGFGLGVTIGDIDQDGWMDIYVSNDFFERDYIYLNKHNGTFRETLAQMTRSISAASMGADIADLNNDRYPEIFATDMVPEHNDRLKTKTTFDDWDNYKFAVDNGYHHQFTRNVLQLNNADGTFSEIGRFAGISATDWSWGALIMDLDNDGFKDIFVANGIYKDLTDQDYINFFSNRDMVMSIITGNNVDYKTLIDAIPSVKIPSYAFKNLGNLRFEDKAFEWGLADPGFSNGASYGDLDNDGDLDMVVNNVNMPMYIYRNNSETTNPANHYLKFILKGDKSNNEAIGTKITIKHKGELRYIEQMPMRGYLSTVDSRPNFGLGSLELVDSVIVEWPDGLITVLKDVKTDQIITLYQKDGTVMNLQIVDSVNSIEGIFRDISTEKRIDFVHRESDFNDFSRDRLIFHMMSTEGPRMSKADVNNDGLEDFYIGGAKDQPGVLMVQKKDGTFFSADKQTFEADKISEDTDAEFFDADNDGDQDLYVASGSNEFPESSSALNDRLYFNQGNGTFIKSSQILPAGKFENTSCVKAADFDGDGIMELFVGIRLKPFSYGVPVNGYILENDGKGLLTDVTSKVAPDLLNTGMIRDMSWIDADKDGDMDILIAGDWMPIKLLINEKGIFREKTDAFGGLKTNGWWNCILAVDIDTDGDMDFIAGNHGLNSKFKVSADKPASMYVNDYDINGQIEQIICTYDGLKSYPIALKHDLTRQIPELEKKYPKYVMYKDQQINDVFTPGQLKNAISLEADLLETSMFINNGNGMFMKMPLPYEVQYSPVYAITANDYNSDGYIDLLMGGNLYNVKPEVGRYDANYGCMLEGNGKGGFKYIPSRKSGFRLDDEIRDIMEINTVKGKLIVIAKSNCPVQVFDVLTK